MFDRDNVGQSILLVTAFFLTRVFAEKWTGLVMAVLAVSLALYRLARRLWKKRASESWASTIGRVETTEVKDGKGFVLHIAYSYKAGDQRYSGFEAKSYRREAQADAANARIRGGSVMVRYNPRKPEESLMQAIAGEL